MKRLMLMSCTAIAVTAFCGVAIASEIDKNVPSYAFAQTNIYSCASIHFGMKDSDKTAMTYDCSTSTSNLSGYNNASGVTIASIACTNVYAGGNYVAEDASYSQYAIRVGKSKGIGSITITFAQQIIGCTIYALQYANDPVTVSVNDQETALATSASSVTKANAAALAYDAYSFAFDATDTLVVKSKQASKTVNGKSVSASRFYLADIALRVAA